MADDELLGKICEIEEKISNIKKEQAVLSRRLKILETEREQLRNQHNLEKSKKESEFDWIGQTFAWSDKVRTVLSEKFHIESFRPKQLAAINATLSKKDVLLLMPTGGGKSLTYQLPACVNNGLTLVVSPLLSLIEDQLMALKKLKIESASINSSTPKEKIKSIYEYMGKGIKPAIKLLYVTPEWIAKSKKFMSYLQKCYGLKNLDRIAIDEVHCCSQWGHDFRPDYKFLGLLKNMFPDVPFIGLTATATMSVLIDVQNMLDMQGCAILKASFNRPNLFYKVTSKPAQFEACLDYLEELLKCAYKDQSGIIYTTTIKDSEEVTKGLRLRGLKVQCYHANLEAEQRSRAYEKWVENKYQAVVATVAFGMGIDKPDVRFVIHYSLPKSMEAFYQESGRAGRDGKKAYCILMYRLSDYFRNSSMTMSKIEDEKLRSVLKYCLDNAQCRRALIAAHFEEAWDFEQCKKMCDHCSEPESNVSYDITSACTDVYAILDNAEDKDTNLTLIKLMNAWFQTGAKDLRVNSVSKPKLSTEQAEIVIGHLLSEGFLKEDKSFTAYAVNVYIRKKLNSLEGVKIEINLGAKCILRGFKKRTLSDDEIMPTPKRLKV